MPPSKGHKKSRNGCLGCKKRRIKCDEEHPKCGNCIKRGIEVDCVYVRTLLVAVRDEEENINPGSSSSDEPSLPPCGLSSTNSEISQILARDGHCVCGYFHSYPTRTLVYDGYPGGLPACAILFRFQRPVTNEGWNLSVGPYVGHFNNDNRLPLTDVSLFQHYLTSTSATMVFANHPEVWETWTDIVPRMTSSHNFVMQALLAVAAAHIDTEESNLMADYYFQQALQSLQSELSGNVKKAITQRNCDALFMTLSIFTLFALSGRMQKFLVGNGNATGTLNHLDTTWTVFLRSGVGVFVNSWTWITTGSIAPYISHLPPEPKMSTSFSCRTEAMFMNLNRLCTDGSIDGAGEELGNISTSTTYFTAIWNLKKIWSVLEEVAGISNPYSEPVTEVSPSSSNRKHRATVVELCNITYHFVLRTPAQFWESLHKKKPRALTIYAYLSVCWEALDFAHRLGSPDAGSTPDKKKDSAMFWLAGRAEVDLKGVEMELRSSGDWDTWSEWIVGAWSVFNGLRAGWWFDQDVEAGTVGTAGIALPGSEVATLDAGTIWGNQEHENVPPAHWDGGTYVQVANVNHLGLGGFAVLGLGGGDWAASSLMEGPLSPGAEFNTYG
ncbi:hypothetical protein D9613_009609 [Agrocybe pediades]|uniref:Zn(2)-C6 fungal-type domain-containing protein n=1 Tax=Agrocybe pediades TaxID=84607 RepID=A0A8H4R2J5_9AGAR|nr:hypothetical protein D9613_009609 [Agrocybe pediades]